MALVLGSGRSGCAAARLLRLVGYPVTLLDESDVVAADVRSALETEGVTLLLGQADLPSGPFDLVVVSPGIADTHPCVLQAQAQCDDVISELELGSRYCECPILAITGTNGKSTLTRLLDDVLQTSGFLSAAGGNLGVPLCELVAQSRGLDWIVAEVSSFQLELVRDFHPRGAVFLNLQPDHLNRHGTMENYLAIKSRIFDRMGAGDCCVVPEGLYEKVLAALPCRQDVLQAQWEQLGENGWHYDAAKHAVCGEQAGQSVSISLADSCFDNQIMGQTAAAAAALALVCCGVKPEHVESAIQAFQPLPHRMAVVQDHEGVLFVDDSKATNLAAMQAALLMQNRPVRLIAGGQAKENDASWVKQVLKNHVVCAYVIGSSAALLEASWSDTIPVKRCGSLDNAMESVLRDVQDGEVVLLSPGCASFDQFRSYAERGDVFARLVKDWTRCK